MGNSLSLAQLQSDFCQALVQNRITQELSASIASDGIAPAARLQIYRNHLMISLADVLQAHFPVVCRLVGEPFFRHAAREFISVNPPATACLFDYGEKFPDFLADFRPCRSLPYLGDVARLEWQMHRVQNTVTETPLPLDQLQEIAAADASRIIFRFSPAFAWIESHWPIDVIWRTNQSEQVPDEIRLDNACVLLEIRREISGASFSTIDAPTFAFRKLLSKGQTLGDATNTALALDPLFNLVMEIRKLFTSGLVTGIGLAASHS